MAGLADLFMPEDYDPKAPPLPNRAVPVRPFGELKPLDADYYRNQPVMDKVSNIGRTLGQAVGFSPTQSHRMGEDTKNLIGFVPGVGDAVGAVEAKESLLHGDIGKGLLQAGLTAIGVVPGVGDLAAKAGREGVETLADTVAAAVKPGIKAYHASPHDFDKFDISKIGTGEGAQIYGHGLYAAESPAVSGRGGSYDRQFTAKNMGKTDTNPFEEAVLREMGTDPEISDAEIMHQLMVKGFGWKGNDGYPDFDGMEDAIKKTRANASHIYEVNIDADPEHFLDWDKPLSEQPDLRQKLDDVIRWQQVPLKNNMGADTTASQLVDYLERKGGKPFATEELRDAGIPGIKYLDAGSRGAADGSRNYVVFDDKLISIVKKYGIPAALGAGLITEEMARQMQDQGIGGA